MDYMKKAASHLARQGRGPDTTLMHVTSREAGILGLLHPDGKLPENPKTGLPEAGWFDTILPMAVGLGATVATGGLASPLVAAGIGGLASGATKTAMTGDLNQGIMTGMLSFGTGAALSGLGGADLSLGADPGATLGSASSTASSAVPAVAGSAPMTIPGAAADAGGILGSAGPMAMPTGADAATAIQSASSIAPSVGGSIAPSASAASGPLGGIGDSYVKAYEGMTGPNAGQYLKNTFITEAPKTTLPILMGGYGTLNPPTPLNVPKEPSAEELNRRYPEQFPDARTVVSPPSGYRPGVDPEFNYFRYDNGMAEGGEVLMGDHDSLYKEGGIASANPSASTRSNIEAEAKMALLGEHPRAKDALARYQQVFGEEAMNALSAKVRPPGGRIRGAGGGLDDLIPGTIEGRKQVRLADGEFVVPADVVSHLGDGSTDQGVRKLYEMMDRIRHSKTGSKKQPGPVKDGKVLPV